MFRRALFSYAEGGKNPVQDIVRRGGTSDAIDGAQRRL